MRKFEKTFVLLKRFELVTNPEYRPVSNSLCYCYSDRDLRDMPVEEIQSNHNKLVAGIRNMFAVFNREFKLAGHTVQHFYSGARVGHITHACRDELSNVGINPITSIDRNGSPCVWGQSIFGSKYLISEAIVLFSVMEHLGRNLEYMVKGTRQSAYWADPRVQYTLQAQALDAWSHVFSRGFIDVLNVEIKGVEENSTVVPVWITVKTPMLVSPRTLVVSISLDMKTREIDYLIWDADLREIYQNVFKDTTTRETADKLFIALRDLPASDTFWQNTFDYGKNVFDYNTGINIPYPLVVQPPELTATERQKLFWIHFKTLDESLVNSMLQLLEPKL